MSELVSNIDNTAGAIEGACLCGFVLVQSEADSRVGSLSGSADEGPEEDVGQRVDKVVHTDDVSRDDTRVGSVDRDVLVSETFCKVEGEEG